MAQCAKAFKTKKIHKGLAFPTCISLNDIVCHFSPLEASESMVLAAGDVVKV
jgi:methionine aminopeptidase